MTKMQAFEGAKEAEWWKVAGPWACVEEPHLVVKDVGRVLRTRMVRFNAAGKQVAEAIQEGEVSSWSALTERVEGSPRGLIDAMLEADCYLESCGRVLLGSLVLAEGEADVDG